jgi:hypothetical protein
MPTVELQGFRHPVTKQPLMMPAADAEAYLQFTQAFSAELDPKGFLEEQLAQSVADAQWRLNQIRAIENNILATERAAYADAPVVTAHRKAKYANALSFSTYEQRLTRQFHQNLKLLRELQAERRTREAAELEQAAQILTMEKSKAAPNQPLKYTPANDGFVFSIPEIEAHIERRKRLHDARQYTATRSAAA